MVRRAQSFLEPVTDRLRSRKPAHPEPFEPKLTYQNHTRLKIKKNPNLTRVHEQDSSVATVRDEYSETVAVYKKKTRKS